MKKERLENKFLDELRRTPIVSAASQKVGINKKSIYEWRKKDYAFREKMDDALEEGASFICDMAESKLIKKISEEHYQSIIFYLRHHSKTYADPEWRFKSLLDEVDSPMTLVDVIKAGLKAREANQKLENQDNSPDYLDDSASSDSKSAENPSQNRSSQLPKSRTESKKDKTDTSRLASTKREKESADKP